MSVNQGKGTSIPEKVEKEGIHQGSTNCAYSDERARNVHIKRFLHAQNYVHINQSKHLTSTVTLFKVVSYFCV